MCDTYVHTTVLKLMYMKWDLKCLLMVLWYVKLSVMSIR